jgi:hypothetical protein
MVQSLVLAKFLGIQLMKNFRALGNPEGSLLYSPKPASGPYYEPVDSRVPLPSTSYRIY